MPVLIIPGVYEPKPQHWQILWEDQIPDARRVRPYDGAQPDRDRWLQFLVAEVERSPGAILVGHSLGATLIAYLAHSRPDLPVGGALLVAPVDPELARSRLPGLASFAPLPLAPFPFPAIVVAGRGDPYMALERVRVIAKLWEAEFVDVSDAGPVDASGGLGAWPEGRALIERLRAPRGYLRPALRFAAAKVRPDFAEAPVEKSGVARLDKPDNAPPDPSAIPGGLVRRSRRRRANEADRAK